MKIRFDLQHWNHVYARHFVIDTDNLVTSIADADSGFEIYNIEIIEDSQNNKPLHTDAEKKCICKYPYINVPGCPKCNPSKLVPRR